MIDPVKIERELAKDLAKAEADQAVKQHAAAKEQAKQDEERARAEALKKAKEHEQSKFKEELFPVTAFIADLKSAGFLERAEVSETYDTIRIHTGVMLGYSYRKNERSAMDDLDYDYRYKSLRHDKYSKFDREIKKRAFDHAILRLKAPDEDQDLGKGVYFNTTASYTTVKNTIEHFCRYGREYSGREILEDVYALGTEFRRGETTSDDVNEFLNALIPHVYRLIEKNNEKRMVFQDIISRRFGINVGVYNEAAWLRAAAIDFKALDDERIKMPEPPARPDVGKVLMLSKKEIVADIDRAVNQRNDPLAIHNIGARVHKAVQACMMDTAEQILPVASAGDVALIDDLRADLRAIAKAAKNKNTNKGNSLGRGLLNMLFAAGASAGASAGGAAGDGGKAAPSTKAPFDEADISARAHRFSRNFGALCENLEQQQAILRQAVSGMSKNDHSLKGLKRICDSYAGNIENEMRDAGERAEDMQQTAQTFRDAAKAIKDMRENLRTAIETEKQAYLDIKRASQTVPYMAVALLKAIKDMRQGQIYASEADGRPRDLTQLDAKKLPFNQASEARSLALLDEDADIFDMGFARLDEIDELLKRSAATAKTSQRQYNRGGHRARKVYKFTA